MKKTLLSKEILYEVGKDTNCITVLEEVKKDFPKGRIHHLETSTDITGITSHRYSIELNQDI